MRIVERFREALAAMAGAEYGDFAGLFLYFRKCHLPRYLPAGLGGTGTPLLRFVLRLGEPANRTLGTLVALLQFCIRIMDVGNIAHL